MGVTMRKICVCACEKMSEQASMRDICPSADNIIKATNWYMRNHGYRY